MNYSYNPTKGLILAIIPFYHDEGTAYKIYYEDGCSEISNNRLCYIMNQYLDTWRLKFRNLISNSKRTDSTGTKPISVTLNHTFIPLRVRKSRIKGDKTYGLFWHEKINYPRNFTRKQIETLSCGIFKFEVYCTYSHLQQKRYEAEDQQHEWKRLNRLLLKVKPNQRITSPQQKLLHMHSKSIRLCRSFRREKAGNY